MKKIYGLAVLIWLVAAAMALDARPLVRHEGDRVFITDRTGVSWDVTQARTLGFDPEKFQYGIGKYAFTPLDDTRVKTAPGHLRNHQRVIGFEHDGEAHAYSVDRLRFHELANTRVGDAHITAGY